MHAFYKLAGIVGIALVLGASAGGALAAGTTGTSTPTVQQAHLVCLPGTHAGYENKYCWPNHGYVCPPGSHLGYDGKYCWPGPETLHP